jgi:hypothetical protein
MTHGAFAAAAVAAAAALAAAAGQVAGPRSAPAPPPPDRALRAAALAGAPGLTAARPTFTAATARLQAALRGLGIPLPAGGTFNGVRWEEGGPVTSAQMDGVLEYNAMCQWLRAWRDGREAGLASRVLQTVPSWPALRGSEAARQLEHLAAGVRLGRRDTTARAVLAGCDASHRREVGYAKELGLAPSS